MSMSEFATIFQPISEKEKERRRLLAIYEKIADNPLCGRCEHWMKTLDCPREKRGLKPSMTHYVCHKYELSGSNIQTLARLRKVVV